MIGYQTVTRMNIVQKQNFVYLYPPFGTSSPILPRRRIVIAIVGYYGIRLISHQTHSVLLWNVVHGLISCHLFKNIIDLNSTAATVLTFIGVTNYLHISTRG